MDKKTIPILIILAILIIGYWPILEFLGIYEPSPPETQTESPIDTAVPAATGTASPLDMTPAATVPAQPEAVPAPGEVAAVVDQPDTMAVDTIIVETEKYQVLLSSHGGGPVSILLKEHTYRDGELVQMLPEAQRVTPEARFAGGTLTTSQLHYTCNLMPGSYEVTSEPLNIIYTFTAEGGATIERKLTFYPDRYNFDLDLNIPEPAKLGLERHYDLFWNTPLGVTEPVPMDDYQLMEVVARRGDSRESLDDYDGADNLNQREAGDVSWAGVRSKYFSAVMIPTTRHAEGVIGQGDKREVVTPQGEAEQRRLIAGLEMPFVSTSPINDEFTVFVGPMDYMMMKEYNVGLEDMLNIGTMPVIGWVIKPFAIGIMWLLPKMYDWIPNYGFVIIIFAFLVKLVTLPLSLKSFKSMQAMKDIQPEIEKLKEKHKKDPQKMNADMMKLYKKHGVNPISGCLPMLPQMPLFFALFAVFRSTILLRDAPFFWFIDDLSRGASGFMDPYIILVVIMIAAQFISQKFTMASTQQNKMLIYMMPLVMGFIFYKFAAGLVLYWTAFSFMTLLDYVIFRRDKNAEVKAA